ncbi:MAG: monofunctional biosynthetic peptidoglycan transglycosylase [Bauldia sp.]
MVKTFAGCYSVPVRLRRTLSRLWRIAWRTAVVLALVPVVLVPLYRIVPPVSTLMITTWLTGQPVARTWVSLRAIAPSLVASVIMSEDGRFCEHRGVDWAEIGKVIDEADDRPRGASTIAMQSAKNLFLWQSRSYLRKALEIPIALYADLIWGKEREIEIYLNVVEWGPAIFGIEAAARHYFGTSAKALTARQAALLAVTLPNPGVRDPRRPSRLMETLAGTVAQRARFSGAYVDCLSPQARL